jgi:hypothetical protein
VALLLVEFDLKGMKYYACMGKFHGALLHQERSRKQVRVHNNVKGDVVRAVSVQTMFSDTLPVAKFREGRPGRANRGTCLELLASDMQQMARDAGDGRR